MDTMDHSVSVVQFAQARASEIATLMHEVSTDNTKRKSWFQNLPHHMRRRNASHNPKRVPKNLRVQNQANTATKPSKGKKHKKQPKDLKAEYASRSKPGSTWLENHIWYAKRFKMKNLWGYQLPLHSNDRKLGSSHNAAANRSMLQDLSYYCCIELSGEQDNLLKQLSGLTDESAGHTFASEMFIDGSKEGHTFLYHPHSFPYKAIGPVSFIWKSVLDEETSKYKIEIPGNINRCVWIWCHPSIHEELVQVLSNIFNFVETPDPESKSDEISNKFTFPCKLNYTKNQQHFCKEKTYTHNSIKMVLRKNTLVRHRLIGPMSLSILTKVLKQADIDDPKDANDAKRFKADETTTTQLWWQSYYKDDLRKQFHSAKGDLLGLLTDPQSSYYVSPGSVIGLTVKDPRIETRSRQECEASEETSTDFSMIDSLLTPEVSDSALWLDDIRNEVTATKLSDQEINKERSNTIGPLELGMKENRIPVMIIHQTGLNGFGSGWDFIAPLGWSLEFWRSFHRKGCTPAGIRDLHFVNLEAGRPSFPCSYPDTTAGQNYEEQVRLEALKEYLRRAKSKRPNFDVLGVSTPFHMCWKTLVKDWGKLLEDSVEVRNLFPSVEGLNFNESSCEDGRDYFVLWNTELRGLSRICGRLNKIPRMGVAEELVEKLSKNLDDFVTSLNPGMELSRSLISVKILPTNKGVPSRHSGIYLLSNEDLKELQSNPHYNGLTEPSHKKNREQKQKSLERPQIETLVSFSSRKMIGYVSEGGFSSMCGRGYGVGHCSSIAVLVVLKQCLEARLRPLVFIKEQHCVKYRVANVEIIDHY
ncbi:hypothetical protein JTE90_005626 [Oedothorax gibbosus]|uniref:Uncharacterized protein n=1 Tax=Oedothorax gibbosus TaxID=931172 RepID=A0AAV6UIK4_9ARAC|nr:hypothetical protein JTE90_005626 [Oedothorax gibbosus]